MTLERAPLAPTKTFAGICFVGAVKPKLLLWTTDPITAAFVCGTTNVLFAEAPLVQYIFCFRRNYCPFLLHDRSLQSGAVIWSKGSLLIVDGNFTNNESPENGGVLFASEFSNFTLAGGYFQGNKAQDGGVLNSIMGSIVQVEGGVYSGNVATSQGGAFSLLGEAHIQVREKEVVFSIIFVSLVHIPGNSAR